MANEDMTEAEKDEAATRMPEMFMESGPVSIDIGKVLEKHSPLHPASMYFALMVARRSLLKQCPEIRDSTETLDRITDELWEPYERAERRGRRG